MPRKRQAGRVVGVLTLLGLCALLLPACYGPAGDVFPVPGASVRGFEGASFRLAVVPTLPLPRGVEVGFVIGMDLGPTHRLSLDAPGVRVSRVPDGHDLHGTFDIGARLGLRL